MRARDVQAADLGIIRLLWLFAILSLLLLAALAAAPVRDHFTEWRAAQERYNTAARRGGFPTVDVGIKQIWEPDLGVVDRCTSCHLGMGAAAPVPHDRLFGAHPAIPHDPRELGCTVCHAGQGRATNRRAAHGDVSSWDEPLRPRRYVEAGCGTCHSGLRVPRAEHVARGEAIVEETRCRGCHRPGAKGPDLSFVGLAGFDRAWHDQHVRRRTGGEPAWSAFVALADEEIAAVDEYLGTLVGAPRLLEGKALAHRLGCRGCHAIGGVGGDDGPELSNVGRKAAGDLDYSGVRGEHTPPGWLREHFVAPARVVAGSQMPDLGLGEQQADLLTLYMLSLRVGRVPERLTPRDRVRTARLGERDFPTDGASLFGVFCAACHGPAGEGRRFGATPVVFPAIGNADFLALVDDAFLRRTLEAGRPGRRMPAWGAMSGGLRPEEIDALVGHLRSREPAAPAFETVRSAPVDLEAGRRTFAEDCGPCHGRSGEGTIVGPPLAAADNLATKDDSRLYGTLTVGIAGTAMGSFRRYDAALLRSVIAAVRALPQAAARRTGWAPRPGDAGRGADLYARACAGCHGKRGIGAEAPALGGAAFLAAASDGYLTASIVRGREGTSMPGFGRDSVKFPRLDPGDVADVVAYLRSLW